MRWWIDEMGHGSRALAMFIAICLVGILLMIFGMPWWLR